MKQDTRITKDAVYLIDEKFVHEGRHPVPSGWDYDPRGERLRVNNLNWSNGFVLETDSERNAPVTLSRRFMPLRTGKANFNVVFTLEYGDGYFFEFYDVDDKPVFTATQKGDSFVLGDGVTVKTVGKTQSFELEFDIDKKSAVVCYNGQVVIENYSIPSVPVARFKQGYRDGAKGRAFLTKTILNINYLVNDRNEVFADGDLYHLWKTVVTGDAAVRNEAYTNSKTMYTGTARVKAGEKAESIRTFEKASGKVCFEVKYLTERSEGEGVKLSLTCGGKECVIVTDEGTCAVSHDGTPLRKHNPNVWQSLRVEADTTTGKAFVKLNGKKCGFIPFAEQCDYFDGISISYAPKSDGVMRFTDVFVFEMQPEPEDYPKPPVLPERKPEYYTGMNICSLWRGGEHVGWDAISAFKDNITYLGFYDEGIPEVSDWEIKWMTEHGLDCEFYCWYARFCDAPNVKTSLSAAIHDGHFNAKYGDYMKLALIWEAGASAHPSSVEQVEKYFIPYFEDYFFTDPRYFAIDNVAIMSLYNTERLAADLGSYEAVKKVVELLRESAKRCGYKDLAILTCGDPSEERKYTGVDAVYAYGWGHNGYDPEFQKNRMKGQIKKDLIHVVPTVSVGYNDVAWRVERHPMISCEDMGKVIDWFKDDLLPSYKNCSEEWKRKLMMFSTWNEYGEGTYICPANLNGFGYLNEMRKAVTVNADSFESDRPSEKVLDRLGYLHPKGRTFLSAVQLVPREKPDNVVKEIVFDRPESLQLWETENTEMKFEDGLIKGVCTANDPKITIRADIEASEIDAVAVKMISAFDGTDYNKVHPETSPIDMFFKAEDEEFHWLRALTCSFAAEDGTLYFLTNGNDLWKNKISHIRIDPTPAEGKFEIESIKFMAFDKQTVRYETYFNGDRYLSHYRTKCEDGKFYISFEPLKEFANLARVYFEWDNDEQTLMIEANDTVSYWKRDSDKAIIGGEEITLKKPLEFYDELPYLPLDEFCAATGADYTVSGNKIEIKTK